MKNLSVFCRVCLALWNEMHKLVYTQCGVCLCAWVHAFVDQCRHSGLPVSCRETCRSNSSESHWAPSDSRPRPNCIWEIATPSTWPQGDKSTAHTDGKHMHICKHTHTLSGYLFTQDLWRLGQHNIGMGRIQYRRQYTFILLGALVVCNAISVNCSLWSCGIRIHQMNCDCQCCLLIELRADAVVWLKCWRGDLWKAFCLKCFKPIRSGVSTAEVRHDYE